MPTILAFYPTATRIAVTKPSAKITFTIATTATYWYGKEISFSVPATSYLRHTTTEYE